MTEHGLDVAFLAIDGVGKPLVAEVERRCAAEGVPVRRLSWQSAFGEPEGDQLESLWLDLYRVFFTDALVGSTPLAVPDSAAALAADPVLGRLKGLPVLGVRPEGPPSTGWLEVGGHTVFHHAVVRPLVAAGTVVLQESIGIKNVLTSLLMAEHLAPDAAAAFADARRCVREYFGVGLAPDLGIHLVGTPVLPPVVGPFDSFAAFGADPEESYLELQGKCAREYAEFAADHGWVVLDPAEPGAADRVFALVLAGLDG